MLKKLGVICLVAGCAGGAVWAQPSASDQHAPLLQGQPTDRQQHAKTPTDAQVMAACIVREQADHTGMSKSEATAACKQHLAPESAHQRTQTGK